MRAASVLLVAFLSGWVALSQAQNLVVFGTDLSDNGFGSTVIGKLINSTQTYPAPPYWRGHYTNGPVWLEEIAASLNVPLEDYACGGATSGATPAMSSPIIPPFGGLTQIFNYQAPNLDQQIDFFLADQLGSADPDDVYLVEFGSNDILQVVLNQNNATASDIATYIAAGVERLYASGARKFILVATTPVIAPASPSPAVTSAAVKLSQKLYLGLAAAVTDTPNFLPGGTATLFDLGGAQLETLAHATKEGITNSSQCYAPDTIMVNGILTVNEGKRSGYLCPTPNSHVFWDNQHLTQAMHANIAKIFLRDTAPLFWEAVPPAGSPLPDIKITPAPGPLVTLAGLAHIVGLYG